MLFNSLEFLVFFVVVFSLYLFLPFKGQNRLLLISSLIFYGFWDWRFLSLIFFSITVDYYCGLKIHQAKKPQIRKTFLLISLLSNLLLLGFFKYFNFFADSLVVLLCELGIPVNPVTLRIILPVGISFYTFQALSYTIDIYRREIVPARSYANFALFVTFFPQLVAGPIERASHLLPQVENPRNLDLAKFYQGCFLIYWGLFEKMFLAGNLARIADPVFAIDGPYNGTHVLVALYAFAFQIFCDFDGYSNMARGLGLCMGFDLMVNFRLPYFSLNPREFWQRWHISLSTWLRDYLYIPLGGNRGSSARTYVNLGLTMLLGGLWHGASWTFVIWGMYHGFLLMGHRFITGLKTTGRISTNFITRNIQRILFFHVVVLGWLFFRAKSWPQIEELVRSLAVHFYPDEETGRLFLRFAAIVFPLICVQIWQYRRNDLMILFKQHWLVKTVIYAVMTFLILGWGILKPEEFIYFQF